MERAGTGLITVIIAIVKSISPPGMCTAYTLSAAIEKYCSTELVNNVGN